LTHAELIDRAARAASGFDSLGIGENDAIALTLRNDFAFFEAAFAAAHLCAYAIPVNWHFIAEEAGYILRDCVARALGLHASLLPHITFRVLHDLAAMVVPTEMACACGIDRSQYAVPATPPPG
jgi:long-chain acyl-CoA synthetase